MSDLLSYDEAPARSTSMVKGAKPECFFSLSLSLVGTQNEGGDPRRDLLYLF